MNLQRMRGLIRHLTRIEWRIQRAKAKATKITTELTGMPRGSGNHSQVEDGAIQIADLEEAYAEAFAELQGMREQLKPLILMLDNPDHVAAMRLRYLNGYSAEDIADAINMSDRQVYRILKQAEREIIKRCQ